MLILHPYVPNYREADQEPCWRGLAEIQSSCSDAEIVHISCPRGSHVWADIFAGFWLEHQDFMVVEHDIELTPEHYCILRDCYWSHCAWRYNLSFGPIYNPPVDPGDGTKAGFGFVRFRAKVTSTPLPEHLHWYDLDTDVSTAVYRQHGAWHLHEEPPLVHHHVLTGGKPYETPHAASTR